MADFARAEDGHFLAPEGGVVVGQRVFVPIFLLLVIVTVVVLPLVVQNVADGVLGHHAAVDG